MRLRVYRNLRAANWSILDPRTNRVVDHRGALVLVDVRLLVSERVRQRVIAQRRRTVHAYAEGMIADEPVREGGDRLHYSPYDGPSFTCAGQVVTCADRIDFRPDGAFLHTRAA